ncbi:MAG: hypothetical protein HY548_00550, partial [Elusimicrobia bacterium]|nr:hypothetical protein [Elusimicrobiota bacterium]
LVVLIIISGLGYFGDISLSSLHQEAGWKSVASGLLEWTPYWMVFIATLFSLVTGISYLRKHRHLLKE